LFLTLLSLAPIVTAYLWTSSAQAGASRDRAAFLAAALPALWFELVYFASAALSEVVATHLLLIGLFLAFPGALVSSRPRLPTAGVLLGLALVLRIQLAPALAVAALDAFLIRRKQPCLPLAAGFAASFLASGLLDWITWGAPWQSIWKYLWINI